MPWLRRTLRAVPENTEKLRKIREPVGAVSNYSNEADANVDTHMDRDLLQATVCDRLQVIKGGVYLEFAPSSTFRRRDQIPRPPVVLCPSIS